MKINFTLFKRKTTLRIFGLILFAFLSISCQPKAQKDCGFVQNVYGQRISWKTKGPIQLFIAAEIPEQLHPAIYRAAGSWEKILGQKLFNITENTEKTGAGPAKDGKNGIYFLSKWEADRKSEQGRTTVYWGADQIMEADIRINALDFSYYDQDKTDIVIAASRAGQVNATGTIDGYNFEALMLHEMGHLLGLKHTDEKSSVMATHLSAFNNRVQPSTGDIQSVQCVYQN